MTGDPNPPSDPGVEQRLREAMRTVDQLQPPRDDLFVDRAVSRGRARANRSPRRALAAAGAAGVLVLAAYGLSQLDGGASTATSSAPASAAASGAGEPPVATGAEPVIDVRAYVGPAVPEAAAAPGTRVATAPGAPMAGAPSGRDTDTDTAATPPVPAAQGGDPVDPLAPLLTRLGRQYPATFAGAWPQGGSVALGFTVMPDAAEQARIRTFAPGAGLAFTTAPRSLQEQQVLARRAAQVAAGVLAERGVWVTSVTNDPRTGLVVLHATASGIQPGSPGGGLAGSPAGSQDELDLLMGGPGLAVWDAAPPAAATGSG